MNAATTLPFTHGNMLVDETDFYEENKESFVRDHRNRHLLIKGRELIGSYETEERAVEEGVQRFGAGPFLVRFSGEDTLVVSAPALALGLLRAEMS